MGLEEAGDHIEFWGPVWRGRERLRGNIKEGALECLASVCATHEGMLHHHGQVGREQKADGAGKQQSGTEAGPRRMAGRLLRAILRGQEAKN